MNTMLSMPSTISSAVRVSSPIQICGSNNHSICGLSVRVRGANPLIKKLYRNDKLTVLATAHLEVETWRMILIDFLLLGGFLAASLYIVYRLFLGWRHSRLGELEDAASAETSRPAASARQFDGGSSTTAAWQRRQSTTSTEAEV